MRQRRSEFDAARRKRFVRGRKAHERSRRQFESAARREYREPEEKLASPNEEERTAPWGIFDR
jgi:hypothetical protein